MDDELRKEKYRCEFNGAEGITIGDLHIKAKNPSYSRSVKIKKGEYILTELLEFEDLKRSRLTGALSQFIKKGWIVVENPSVPTKLQPVAAPNAVELITERLAGTVLAKDVTNLVTDAPKQTNTLDYPTENHPQVVETITMEESRTPNTFAISENDAEVAISADKVEEAFNKFNSLRYFQKLKAIRDMTDTRLLEIITQKSNYPQLIHNSKNRLREIQNGK